MARWQRLLTVRASLSPSRIFSLTQYNQQIVWRSALEASHSTQHPQPSRNNVAWWQCQGRRHHQGGRKASPLVSTTEQRRGRGIWIRASPLADPYQEHLERGSRISLPPQIPNLYNATTKQRTRAVQGFNLATLSKSFISGFFLACNSATFQKLRKIVECLQQNKFSAVACATFFSFQQEETLARNLSSC